jgi:hypothetical protein
MAIEGVQRTNHFQDQSTIQNIPQKKGRFSTLSSNIGKVSIIAVTFFTLANLPAADATPAAYAACCALCGTATGVTSAGILLPLGIGACLKACLPLFFAPVP